MHAIQHLLLQLLAKFDRNLCTMFKVIGCSSSACPFGVQFYPDNSGDHTLLTACLSLCVCVFACVLAG